MKPPRPLQWFVVFYDEHGQHAPDWNSFESRERAREFARSLRRRYGYLAHVTRRES